ncbi:reverse transcriptase domain-containing protein [Tanacetum coccineum]
MTDWLIQSQGYREPGFGANGGWGGSEASPPAVGVLQLDTFVQRVICEVFQNLEKKTRYKLRRFSTSEERTRIRMMELVPVAPKVGASAVASPARMLKLDTHSSLEADPSESSLPPVSVAPMVLPFLCSDDSESDTKMLERHVSPTPHDAMLTRWRSRVVSRSSSPTTSTPDIPTAPIPPVPYVVVAPSTDIISPVDAPPEIRRRRAILIRPGQDIPIGRLYRTHPGGSCRSHSVSGHTPPDITIADSSAPSRFVYPPLARTPWYSEAYRRWRSAPLSTMYPPTTSESSAGDSFSESSARPSRKRCRSPTATVTSSIHSLRALVPYRVDLLLPRKRFRDSISPEDSVEEDIDADVLADIEADAMAIKVAVDRDVEAGVDSCIGIKVDVEVDVKDEVEEEVESNDRGTMEVGVDVVAGIDIPDGMLMPDAVERLEQVEEETRSLIAGGERSSLLEQVASLERSNVRLQGTLRMKRARADRFRRCMSFMDNELRQIPRFCYYDRMRFKRLETFAIMTITHSGMTPEAIEELINQRVAKAAYEANHAAKLAVENQSQNGDDDDDNRNVEGNGNGNGGGNGDGNGGGNGNGNKNGGGNGNRNPNRNDRGVMHVARVCTYHDFVKCQPLNFRGTEGVVRLKMRFEKMETIFHISNCLERYQIKYDTCTLLNSALTWWNAHKRTIGAGAAFAMLWRELMKLMTEVYCLRNEIQKMESELWNLSVKNNDLAAYTQRFQELTMMCTKMVPEEEEDRVENFIRGLPDNIQENVIVAEPIRLQDAVRIANNVMDQKLKGYAVKSAENKRSNEKKRYVGPLPYCNKSKLHHEGPCTVKCGKCNKVGHMTKDCMNVVATTATQRVPVVNQRVSTCFKCGRQGHYMNECPKLKNQTRENKAGK